MTGFILFYVQITMVFQIVCLFIPIKTKDKFRLLLRCLALAIVAIATFFFVRDFQSLDGFSIFLFVALSAMNIVMSFNNKLTLKK